jgi:lysyl-tRNA synthetase class 2
LRRAAAGCKHHLTMAMDGIERDGDLIYSPCDAARLADGKARFGGRVARWEPPSVWIHDAFATLHASLRRADPDLAKRSSESDPAPGDLVTLEGHLEDGRLVQARVLANHHRPGRAPALETERLGGRGIGENLRRRAAIIATLRRFFEERAYLEVETPALVPSPGLDLHLDAFQIHNPSRDESTYLVTSPEYQMKRLLSGGMPRIVQLARCFRQGEQGGRHNPEFTMVEWYRAFSTVAAMMTETEALVRHVFDRHLTAPLVTPEGRRIDWAGPFERLALTATFERFAQLPPSETLRLAASDEDRFFRLLVEQVEPGLARLGRPVFVHDFPAPMASLARLKPGAPEVCERFELYVGDLELCNGFGELTDPDEQRRRLDADQARRTAAGKPVYPIDERFLAALTEGMPPAAGNALGLDRLIALCLGSQEIADTQSFPAGWL